MEKAISLPKVKSKSGIIIFDLAVLSFIYFLPALSHLLVFPLYYFDPMRFVLVFTLLHTTKRNTFIIALSLPLFSFFISSHPSMIKAGLLSTELLLNVFLYFVIVEKLNSRVFSLFISILISKIAYYLLKYLSIETGILTDKLFSTPFYYQSITILLIASYVFLFERFSSSKNN